MKEILKTKRLVLGEYAESDFDALYAILSDPVTMQHYPAPYDDRGTRRWIAWCMDSYQTNGFGLWAMRQRDSAELIGDCGISLQRIDGEQLPELGYHLRKDFWRMGFGKEAARAVRNWFFQNTDFNALYSYMNQTNLPSYATAASVGMKRIKAYHDGTEALFVYRITREEWQSLREKEEEQFPNP